MADITTYEEAKTCPKCGKIGEVTRKEAAPRSARLAPGTEIHHITCKTELCPWYNTICRIVQVNPDGTVPPPTNHTGTSKVYVGFEDHNEKAALIRKALQADAERETQPGHEIRYRGR